MAKKETFNLGVTDLDGKPVPDCKVSPVFRDMMFARGDFDADCRAGVHAYMGGQKMPLAKVDLNKYIVKFIAGLWRMREKPTKSYEIVNVYDKQFILGDKICIQERDCLKLEYYFASEVRYDMFGVLNPEFNMYISKCNTIKGPMLRYGVMREDARAFLRGEILDDKDFAPQIAAIVLGKKIQKNK